MGTEEHTSQFSVSVNPGVLHTRHHKGDIALYLAAENGYFDIARVLIENGADINQYTNKYTDYLVEFTPLRAAISKAHIDIINLLLEHNEDVNLPFAGNSTALFSAIGNVSVEIVEKLLRAGADVNHRDNSAIECTPLLCYLYSYRGDIEIEIFQILLKYGADINIKYGSEGNDILHQAVSQGLVNHVKLLLKKGCNIHTKNNNGETLLHFAAEVHCYFDRYTHHDDLVKHLLNHGIDPNHKNNEGKIALDILLERFKHFCVCSAHVIIGNEGESSLSKRSSNACHIILYRLMVKLLLNYSLR